MIKGEEARESEEGRREGEREGEENGDGGTSRAERASDWIQRTSQQSGLVWMRQIHFILLSSSSTLLSLLPLSAVCLVMPLLTDILARAVALYDNDDSLDSQQPDTNVNPRRAGTEPPWVNTNGKESARTLGQPLRVG